MTMTSVTGHLMEKDFTTGYANWSATAPASLFTAEIVETVPEGFRKIAANLEQESKRCNVLVIWTDCDREGEYIGWEVAKVCTSSNSALAVYRARFSVVNERELKQALSNLVVLNVNQVNAVRLRMDLDLREGAALTRFLTLFLRDKFSNATGKVISYGSCQFPTLGFVVEQYLKRERFVAEVFYYLQLSLVKNQSIFEAAWERNRIFDYLTVRILYKLTSVSKDAVKVVSFSSKPTVKRKPLPLTTIEMQKFLSSFYKMPSHHIMKIAEDLYNQGIISYPRTETDVYDGSFNFTEILNIQKTHPVWGLHASRVLEQGICKPRPGRHNDKAHPPIHPTGPGLSLQGDAAKVYEFITRRFIAGCCEDAKGFEKLVTFSMGTETFRSKGLTVTDRNYLDVYTYDKWSSNQIPDFVIGEIVPVESYCIQQGSTSAPKLLTEAQLISTMDRNGIGTDATIHEHIKKIQERNYAKKTRDHRIEPTPLGLALVCGHDDICKDKWSLTKPHLRAMMEEHLRMIENGEKNSEESARLLLDLFVEIFGKVSEEKMKLFDAFVKFLGDGNNQPSSTDTRIENNSHSRNTHNSNSRRRNTESNGANNQNATANNNSSNSNFPRNNQSSSIKNSTSTNPLCNCNNPSVKKSTSKYVPPRDFYVCSKASGCKFFMWESDLSVINANSHVASFQTVDSSTNQDEQDCDIRCECNLRPKRQQSKTEKNFGKFFFSCPKQIHRCNFFKWVN